MSEVAQLNVLFEDAKGVILNLTKKVGNRANQLLKAYGTDDGRWTFFQHYTVVNLWALISLDTSIELTKDRSTRISRYLVMDPKTRFHYYLTHDQFNRQAYVTLAMFHVEDFVKNLMRGIGKPPKGNYFGFTGDFLKQLGMNNPQQHRILNAPYQLRNALHNNGYPYHNFEITLRGNHYVFEKGKLLNFTGWNHLHVFFDELTDLLIEVTDNPIIEKISSVPHSFIRRTD